jgi:flavodoxin
MRLLHTKFKEDEIDKTKKEDKLKAWVVYASLSGNAESVAGSICDGLNKAGITTHCSKAEISNASEVYEYDLIVLVSSTYDVGKLNNHMVKFNLDLSKLDLSRKIFQVVGLGDSEHYDIFCGAASLLEKTILNSKGTQLQKPLKIDGSALAKLREYQEYGFKLAKTLKLSLI